MDKVDVMDRNLASKQYVVLSFALVDRTQFLSKHGLCAGDCLMVLQYLALVRTRNVTHATVLDDGILDGQAHGNSCNWVQRPILAVLVPWDCPACPCRFAK